MAPESIESTPTMLSIPAIYDTNLTDPADRHTTLSTLDGTVTVLPLASTTVFSVGVLLLFCDTTTPTTTAANMMTTTKGTIIFLNSIVIPPPFVMIRTFCRI